MFNSNKITTMEITFNDYKLYVKFCERLGLRPVSRNNCTLQLIQAMKIVTDSYNNTNINL